MSTQQHTPGPWEVVRSVTCGHLRAAHNYQSNPKNEWTNADIKLIAAAPDLLDALKRLCDTKDDDVIFAYDEWEAARAAIAKACE
jgi:uncharacterized membrane protein